MWTNLSPLRDGMTRYVWKISIFMPLKTEEKNVIELKENEQSNINFNYVKTSPDHRTAGNLAH